MSQPPGKRWLDARGGLRWGTGARLERLSCVSSEQVSMRERLLLGMELIKALATASIWNGRLGSFSA